MAWLQEQSVQRGLPSESETSSTSVSKNYYPTTTSVSSSITSSPTSSFSTSEAYKQHMLTGPNSLTNEIRTKCKKSEKQDLDDILDIDDEEDFTQIEDPFDMFIESQGVQGEAVTEEQAKEYQRQDSIDLDHYTDDEEFMATIASFPKDDKEETAKPATTRLSVTEVAVNLAVNVPKLNIQTYPLTVITIPPEKYSNSNSENLSGCSFEVYTHLPSLTQDEFYEVLSSVENFSTAEDAKPNSSPFGYQPDNDKLMQIEQSIHGIDLSDSNSRRL